MGVGAWRQGCPGCCLQCFDLKTLMHKVWGSHDCWNELLHLPAVGGELLQVLLPKEGISLLLGWLCVPEEITIVSKSSLGVRRQGLRLAHAL